MVKNVLITGGLGFIGFHTSRNFLEMGYNVIVVDNINNYYDIKLKEDKIPLLKKYNNFIFKKIDICNYKKFLKFCSKFKIDLIIHLAAQAGVRYSIDNPFIYEKNNVMGTLNILEIARNLKIKDIIFASSSSVYGGNEKIPFLESHRVDNPVSLYAATKKSCELIAYTYNKLYDINITGLRFFTVYGPWGRPDMAIYKFFKSAYLDQKIDVYNKGDMLRDFTYIDDIVDGIYLASKKMNGYRIYNLGNNKPEKLMDLINYISEITSKKIKKKYLPMQKGDVYKTYANIDLAKKELGYNPKTSLKEGLKKFNDWYINYYKL
ncbi:MAG: GDP-mannose 4,6-dehydratase [Candidatus Nanoarchaeia archaeon]|nr:GDP-mannose 4,6-dehydratase [Candidatus Nanoarchaeia archaeon]